MISQDKYQHQSGRMKQSGEQTSIIIQQWNDRAQAMQERRARGSDRRQRHTRDQYCCCRQYLRNLESDEPHERLTSVNERYIDKKYLRAAFMRFGQQLDGLKIWHKFYTWDRVLARGENANLEARPDISTCKLNSHHMIFQKRCPETQGSRLKTKRRKVLHGDLEAESHQITQGGIYHQCK